MTVEQLTSRLDKAALVIAKVIKTNEDLVARVLKLETADRQHRQQITALKTAVANAKNENRSADPFYVGLEFCRERDGDVTLTYDPAELRSIGKKLLAERAGAKPVDVSHLDECDPPF